MKKFAIILTCIIVIILPFMNAKQTHAIGVVGSNAVKGAVINSLESAGVKFTNKEAKERAFEAWNMKAYEKWKADEAAGRNADLWEHFNSVTQQMASSNPIQAVPDKPNYGKMLLDATWFGMAISIGAEIGFAIQDAQLNETRIRAMANDPPLYEGISFNPSFGLTYTWEMRNGSHEKKYWLGDSWFGSSMSPIPEDPSIYMDITGYKPFGDDLIQVDINQASRRWDGTLEVGSWSAYLPKTQLNVGDGFLYDYTPKPEHVPLIMPNPHVEPLVRPEPDISSVPGIIPQQDPVPMIVPLGDPFEDNPYIEPYAPVGDPVKPPEKEPGTEPGKEPGTNPGGTPGATPGQDPNKKPIPETIPEPGAIKDPFEQPKEIKEENLSCERVQRPDFKPLGNAFTTSFPFSVPWDLKRYLDASFSGIGSEKPKFDLPFFGEKVQITIPDALDKYVGFFKGFLLIVFDVGIIYLFVRFMRGSGE